MGIMRINDIAQSCIESMLGTQFQTFILEEHQNEVFYHPLIILCSAALSLKLELDSSSALDSPSVCYVLDVSGCLY